MNKLIEFIESGILEQYVMGNTSDIEVAEVEAMASKYPEIQLEIDSISAALEHYTNLHAVTPDPTVKYFLLAKIDYMTRMENGEAPGFPPLLNENSKIADYAEWLNRKDLQLSETFVDAEVKIIGNAPNALTAIVWLKDGAPPEIHKDQFEKFLVVEGSCNIYIDGEKHPMKSGDKLTIPLFSSHYVEVTSEIPCKIILQRVAA